MLYKETGQYKSTYQSDHAIFPLAQDKIAFSILNSLISSLMQKIL